MRKKSGQALACTLMMLLVSPGAIAQDDGQPQAMFFAPVDVPLVSIEVYVYGPGGRPFPGLSLEDFEIYEDGKKVEISHFYASPGIMALPEEEVAEEEQPEPEFTEPGPDQALYLVVYFDDTNLTRGRRQAAVDHLRDFLSSELPPDLRVMMVRYDGRNHIEVPFTEETDEVLVALEKIKDSASLTRRIDETILMREIQNSATVAAMSGDRAMDVLESSGASIWMSIETFVEQAVHRTRTSIENQERLIGSLSGLSGRKAILLVTDGIEPRPGEALYRAWGEVFRDVPAFRVDAQRAFTQAARNDMSREYGQLAQLANGHRVSFYTLSSMNTGAQRALSAETRTLDEGSLAIDQGIGAEVLMANMAGMTGGRALVNSPALAGQLDEVSQELASYYSVAFIPQHLGDGKYHRLEVKIKKDGVRVRHRDGYLDVPLEERMNNRTLAAAIHGVADNPLGITAATTGDIIRRDDGTFLVPVIITVPIDQLVLIPTEAEHQGRISIHLTVRDGRGDLSPAVRREYPISIPNASVTSALGQSAGFTMRLAVRSGKQRIAVGMRDEVARTESVTFFEVEVGREDGVDG